MAKISFVTGATRNLGFSLAQGLARRLEQDDVVYLTGRDSGREYVRSRSRLSEVPERLWTNLLLFADLPDALLRLELDDAPAADAQTTV